MFLFAKVVSLCVFAHRYMNIYRVFSTPETYLRCVIAIQGNSIWKVHCSRPPCVSQSEARITGG